MNARPLIQIHLPLLLTVVAGCGTPAQEVPAGVVGQLSRSATGYGVLALNQSIRDVTNAAPRHQLEPDLVVGLGDGPDFGSLVDVRGDARGGFIALDPLAREVLRVDPQGTVLWRRGRLGNGPGEFNFPRALSLLGANLLVWDHKGNSAFTLIDKEHWRAISTAPPQIPGDWRRYSFREPIIQVEGFQSGTEDWTFRLRSVGDSAFLHLIRDDETDPAHVAAQGAVRLSAHLVRYNSDLSVRDTVSAFEAPQLVAKPEITGLLPRFAEPMYAPRPVWTTGDGWIAIGHGDSSRVAVLSDQLDTVLVVTWPAAGVPVSDQDRLDAARWILALRVINFSASREIFEQSSRRELREAVRGTAFRLTEFPGVAPEITAMHASGQCLFLVGFSPRDSPYGSSLAMLSVDVQTGTVLGTVRLNTIPAARLEFDRQGAVLKDVAGTFAFAIARDRDGVPFVLRYPLPDFGCLQQN